MKANSVDSIVTDPPYGLAFMNKHWDYSVPSVATWKQVLRVLKPGGHLLSFGGTRTYHRMVVNIEDAGFEIRDQILWIYGQGFPKSLNISIAIDKAAGAIGARGKGFNTAGQNVGLNKNKELRSDHPDYIPPKAATPEAAKWEGWGTALKPANEPIVLARKPLSEKTVAANVLKWGTGGLNIDAGRIGAEQVESGCGGRSKTNSVYQDGLAPQAERTFTQGRFPANVLFDEEAARMLDEQSGQCKSGGSSTGRGFQNEYVGGEVIREVEKPYEKDKASGASRFFYCAKASKSERNRGLTNSQKRVTSDGRKKTIDNPFLRGETTRHNFHPTVKPLSLTEYLIRLITPPGGIVLDPFMGSGTTGIACKGLGFGFVGIEREREYFVIARARIRSTVFKRPGKRRKQ